MECLWILGWVVLMISFQKNFCSFLFFSLKKRFELSILLFQSSMKFFRFLRPFFSKFFEFGRKDFVISSRHIKKRAYRQYNNKKLDPFRHYLSPFKPKI